jgi:DNA-binding transcriptional LysR family regulator
MWKIGIMYKSGLVELEAVLAVAKRQSFRAAAIDLDMSTSAISSAIAGLESRMGVRLFHRTTRSVSLTDAGKRFVEEIQPAVRKIQDSFGIVTELGNTPTGTLRINSSLGAALIAFKPIMLEFLKRYPSMSIDLVTDGRLVDIIAEGFDAGLRTSSLIPMDMIRVPLSDEVPMVVVGSARYFDSHKKPTQISDLDNHQCIKARLPSGMPSPWEFKLDGKMVQKEVPGVLVLDSPVLMLEAVRQNFGLAQVAEWYVKDDIKKGTLECALNEFATPLPGLCLYYTGHRHIPAGLRALIELIQEVRNISV